MTSAMSAAETQQNEDQHPHEISVVIPVFQGERHLPPLLAELAPYANGFVTPDGHAARMAEAILVFDNGPDDSARVMRELAQRYGFVRTVWLSRNYGQHAATLAGMSSSGGDWVLTIDEDGQQDPADMVAMLDTALRESTAVVYGAPTNKPPHGVLRNAASRGAKWFTSRLAGATDVTKFNSYRLILGEIGRSVAAYAGSGVYLDIALSWVANGATTCPVTLRDEGDRRSGYSTRTLASHFWRMVLTSGTRGLRAVSAAGLAFAVLGVLAAIVLSVARLAGADIQAGWTSLIVVVLISSGAILFSLGVLAEYLGVAVSMAMGRPPYLIMSDPAEGALGRTAARHRVTRTP
jgi:polyisoprenyl-phosphate glycosyltransferase